MSTGLKSKKSAGVLFLCIAVLCLGTVSLADTAATHSQKKTKKTQPQLPPLPSGPTGPVQQIPLDSIAPVAPQVSYQNGQLTIVAPNSTLGDILRAVRKQTGAEIEIPPATERVVTHLGPGPARDVMAELLNGSRFNYVLLGSPADASLLTRVVLVAKTSPDNANPNNPGGAPAQQAMMQQGNIQPGNMAPPPPEMVQDTNDADAVDENATDENADQNAAEAEQQQVAPQDQPGVQTPQQMLQEMQQRQLQLQQQQPPGQPPIPGTGMPPGVVQRPPQEQ
jgi:hypothetical protein